MNIRAFALCAAVSSIAALTVTPGAQAIPFRQARAAQVPTYTVTELPSLGGTYSDARGINGRGMISGSAAAADGKTADVVAYVRGRLHDYGTLGGDHGVGNAVNRSGQIAGYSTDASGNYRAFVTQGRRLVDIGGLGGGTVVAYGINDAGNVVGASDTTNGLTHPFLYQNGVMHDLGTLGNNTPGITNAAYAINDRNDVVGTSYDATGNFFGFRWVNGHMRKIGTLGGDWSEAFGINRSGQVTGIAYTPGNISAHAFIWSKGALQDLGLIAGANYTWGLAINDAGEVVGRADIGSDYKAIAYLGGKLRDLNSLIPRDSGWKLQFAFAVNDGGAIVGDGVHNGAQRAFLLTPNV